MRLLFTGLLLSFNLHYVVGQKAKFYTKNDTIEAKIQASSSLHFLTSEGNIKYKDIKKVSFNETPNDVLAAKLSSHDITYFIGDFKVPKPTRGVNFGFHYESKKLFYERIYFNEHSMLVNSNGLVTKLKSLPGFSYETIGEQIIVGSFEDISVPSITSSMNTPTCSLRESIKEALNFKSRIINTSSKFLI